MGNIISYEKFDLYNDYDDAIFCDVKMVVFNLTGTVVTEDNVVSKVIQETFNSFGVQCDIEYFSKHCNNDKIKLIKDIIKHSVLDDKLDFDSVMTIFYKKLRLEYLNTDNIKPINGSVELFTKLKEKGIKVCLTTEYSKAMANEVINKVGLGDYIDGFVSSEEVKVGKPFPYMIYRLMERFNVDSGSYVVNIGDSVGDILGGRNANTLYNVGVLTGRDSIEQLYDIRPDLIVDSIKELLDDRYY